MPRNVYYFREYVCAAGHRHVYTVEASDVIVTCETCGDDAVRPEVLAGLSAAVHGDELDYIDNNLGRDPVHIRSKSQRRALMAAAGLEEFIRHTPTPGGDTSPYTTDWSKGSIDPYTLEAARVLTTRQNRVVEYRVNTTGLEEAIAPVANPFVHTASPEEVRDLIEAIKES